MVGQVAHPAMAAQRGIESSMDVGNVLLHDVLLQKDQSQTPCNCCAAWCWIQNSRSPGFPCPAPCTFLKLHPKDDWSESSGSARCQVSKMQKRPSSFLMQFSASFRLLSIPGTLFARTCSWKRSPTCAQSVPEAFGKIPESLPSSSCKMLQCTVAIRRNFGGNVTLRCNKRVHLLEVFQLQDLFRIFSNETHLQVENVALQALQLGLVQLVEPWNRFTFTGCNSSC